MISIASLLEHAGNDRYRRLGRREVLCDWPMKRNSLSPWGSSPGNGRTMGDLRKLWRRCRTVETSFAGVLARYAYYRARGRTVVAARRVTIRGLANIETRDLLTIGMAEYGFSTRYDRTLVRVRGAMVVLGRFSVGRGCRIDVGRDAEVVLGRGYIAPNTTMVIMHGLTIGDDCAISWGCQFLDEDFHAVTYDGRAPVEDRRIGIGSHVWLGSRVTVLKGVSIADGCVVASGSVVTKRFDKKNCLIAGNPAHVIQTDIKWQ